MKKKKLWFLYPVLALVLAFSVAVPAVSVNAITIKMPHNFYGSVTIGTELAAAETEIEATGVGVVPWDGCNPITTTVVGEYSGLRVKGDIDEGTEIEFLVDGVPAQVREHDSTGAWLDSYPWHDDGMTELDLAVPAIESVDVVPVTHLAGVEQVIEVTVTTSYVADDTVATVSFVDQLGEPLAPAITNTGAITDNSAIVNITVSDTVAAGDYQVKVEVAGIAEPDLTTYTITAPVSATIDPAEANYDLFVLGDIETTITGNDAEEVASVTYDGAPLTVDTDYTVTAINGTATLAILQSYIEGIDPAVAVDDELVFTIAFDVGEDATFTVNVIDTTPVSATISPIEADYDLFVLGDIETTITWNDTTSVVSVEDAVGALTTPDDYEVVGDALTIKDAYLAGKLLAVGDSVVLTIAFDVGDPATFTITAIDTTPAVSATISPIEANYDLYAPADIETIITWNDAASVVSVEDAVGVLATPDDYAVVGDALTLKDAYLAGKLLEAGDALVFTIAFDVGEDATFTVNVIWSGASATISPAEANYDLYASADVETTITWNDAASVVSVEDAVGALATPDDYEVVGDTLTIKDAYLAGKLLAVDDSVVLTIAFDVGEDATFTITAIDTTPVGATISPIEANYDLYAPGDVETTITWNDAASVASVSDGGDLTVVDDYIVDGTTLTIKDAYLAGKLLALDDSVVLTIAFDAGEDATFTVNVIWSGASATISPIEANYDLYAPGDVETTITWNDAAEVVSVTYDGALLTVDTDYTVTAIDGTATLAILQSHIEGIDPAVAVDDALVFTIAFDAGEDATFTVNVIWSGASATISPIEADYDLYAPGGVETTITWNDAASVASVSDGGDLTVVDDYIVDGTTLTIKDAYLAGKLLAVDDSVVLTIAFDAGDPATFTITAIDTTPVYDVLLTLNDGWTLISTDKWIDADSSAWGGDVVLVYRYTSEGYLEATLADLEPVEALYVKMLGGGEARLTYSDVVPGVSAKELVAGWNLISSATADKADAVLSPLRYVQIGEQQVVGLTTLVGQASYNVSGVSLYLATLTDANWETLADTSLNPFDGYWVYMNGAKIFGVIPE